MSSCCFSQIAIPQNMPKETRKGEATPLHSFLCNFFPMLRPSKAKANVLHVPQVLPPLCTSTSSPCARFEHVFRYVDEDGDGKISPAELRSCVKAIGQELTAEDAEDVVHRMDTDRDGLLGYEDFVKLVEVEEEEEKARNLREAFGVYEMEGEECITPKSLRRALERLGLRRSVEECEAMVRRFDIDGDGVISFEEFKVMML